ncbi:metal-dependent glycoprotease [Streptomyces lincolnensis]|uniref:Metal-dependent glycoprotease n=1 Tax=Streptomyces lincolnensis TaxID=1915 RepID=A0A1B1MMT2_STRLN|nr:amidohydrolase [Streptomyces lincolnensis]ANS69921.1 metal-dependent glycoprotease [Streptomyces lincolnensis]AXG58839.1 metal-dependent glycoprotease [Streptomyces lincolnensis]QMV11456.1 amidohydrolase family protein [Streptomyces lincolnensis]
MYADLLFAGGPVLTPEGRTATTVAVTGDRITAVGREEVRDLAGPRTEVVELAGRLLLPGFQDAHVHPVPAGLELTQCDLTGTRTADETVAAVRAYADAHPGREWITGGGWSMEAFEGGTPAKELLDAAVPDRPVYLPNRDHHGAWVNSRALERAGITRHTPDPADGRIERDASGEPSGTLQEGAMQLVGRLTPPATPADRLAALLHAQRHLHALGITAWQDALVGDFLGMDDPSAAYVSAARDGSLTARVVGALWWDRERGAEQIPELVEKRAEFTHGRFRAKTVKLMLDGVAETGTAALLEPYLDRCGCVTTNRGTSFLDAAHLPKYVTELDALGFQCHFHALGDRAVRDALDAVAAARAANGPSDTRPHLAHLQVVHPDDVPRFARLGATATIQPLWAAHEPQMDELTMPFLGAERAARQYPFGALLRSGATLAAGSDWPVSSPDPIQGIHVAVNRRTPDARDRPVFLPAERLGLAQALTAYTAGSAYANHLDDSGRVRVGALADLVVLDRDPFAGPAQDIARTRVALTYVGGERVYAADGH